MAKKTLTIPLFPLQEITLFPHTYLPLHIFEPRYQEMMRDALEGEQLIGIVQLKPGWEENYYESPGIYKCLGVGEIREYTEYEDGRFDFVIEGKYRAHILSESIKGQYRQATVEILEDVLYPGEEEESAEIGKYLKQYLEELIEILPDGYSLIPNSDIEPLSPTSVIDILGSIIIDDPYERQCLLSETSLIRRQQLLRVQVNQSFVIQDPPEEIEPQ